MLPKAVAVLAYKVRKRKRSHRITPMDSEKSGRYCQRLPSLDLTTIVAVVVVVRLREMFWEYWLRSHPSANQDRITAFLHDKP